jgi:hypothetical protein
MAERQHAWIPAQLPSRGQLYGDKIPDGRISLRKITVDEEATLNTQGMDATARLNHIIRNCSLLPEGVSHDELLITDRMAILLGQRIHTFGPKYSFTFRCKHCGNANRTDLNMVAELDEITPDVVANRMAERGVVDFVNEEPFTVHLPDANADVRLRFLRGKDQNALLAKAKRMRMATNAVGVGDPAYKIQVAMQIVEVVGRADLNDPFKKEMWVGKLTGLDSATMRIAVEERETGIDTDLYINCKSCGTVCDVPLPFDSDFFQPSRL